MAQGPQGLQRGQDRLVLRLLDTQVLLGAVEELRTEWAKNVAWGQEGKEGSSSWSCWHYSWLDDGSGLVLDFVVVVDIRAGRPSIGKRTD